MDEREGLPSASTIERIWACPGSLRMSRGLPELTTPEMARYAEGGDRIHLWLEAPDFVDLSPWPEELEVAQACLEQLNILKEWVFGGSEPIEVREHRFWLYDATGKKCLSAKADYAAWSSTRPHVGLVADYKSNRGNVTDSSYNLQLRAQAVLFDRALRDEGTTLDAINVAIIQPLVSKKPHVTAYNRSELIAAEKELLEILDRANRPKAPLNPGPKQCKFCPARLKCPAAVGIFDEVSELDASKLVSIDPKDLALLLDKCALAEEVIEQARAHAKALLKEDANAVPGWTLKENSPARVIKEPNSVLNVLSANGFIDYDTFVSCVSVSIAHLERGIKEFANLKPKEVKPVLEKFCSEYIELKPKQPTLEKEEAA